ncbi:nad dependent epimerase [Colletotrichum truncatum]|uniref:Nad dependent epimerase n=1 Tax=Colletotrichum truncatum TaxID=5467 RepID=A0ACC3YIX0_COLTU
MPKRLVNLPWASLPKGKAGVVALIASVRVVDFYQIASFQTCITLHIQHLQPGLSSTDVARHVGVAQGMFTAAQIVSAPLWGVATDRIGRKAVILVGLVTTAAACIGVAFAGSIGAIVAWRLFAGALNGTVVAARAAMSDNLALEHRPAGFSLLVLSFNIANTIGPLIAAVSIGHSSKGPLTSIPSPASSNKGVMSWAASHPFATPNLLSALVLVGDAIMVWYKLKEIDQDKYTDLQKTRYQQISDINVEAATSGSEAEKRARFREPETKLDPSENRLDSIWTPRFIIVLCTVTILEFHLGAFGSLWPLFVVAARRKTNDPIKLPFLFNGGLELQDADLGFAVGMLGIIGVALQLTAVPHLTAKHGVVRAFKASLPLFPASLFIAPYLALLPAGNGWVLWAGILFVLLLHVIGRSFGILVSILLVNQSTTQSSRRGTVHGIANAVASTSRSAGSIAGGMLYGLGLQQNVVGLGWWVTCCVGIIGWILGRWL